MIDVAEVDLIVEEIVNHLRQLKVSETEAAAEIRRCIEAIDQTYCFNADIAPGATRSKHERFFKSLTQMIEDYETLPAGSKVDLMHFAPPYRTWPPQDPTYMVDALLPYLKHLATVAGSPQFTSKDGSSVKYMQTRDKAAKTAAAGWAHKLMERASIRQPAATIGGPYEAIASLMYKAVSGIDVNMKEWCRRERKRQSDHQKKHDEILRELREHPIDE